MPYCRGKKREERIFDVVSQELPTPKRLYLRSKVAAVHCSNVAEIHLGFFPLLSLDVALGGRCSLNIPEYCYHRQTSSGIPPCNPIQNPTRQFQHCEHLGFASRSLCGDILQVFQSIYDTDQVFTFVDPIVGDALMLEQMNGTSFSQSRRVWAKSQRSSCPEYSH